MVYANLDGEEKSDSEDSGGSMSPRPEASSDCHQQQQQQQQQQHQFGQQQHQFGVQQPQQPQQQHQFNVKPKIWSLADTAACKTPPPMVGPATGAQLVPPSPYSWSVSPMVNMAPMVSMAGRFASADLHRNLMVLSGASLKALGRPINTPVNLHN